MQLRACRPTGNLNFNYLVRRNGIPQQDRRSAIVPGTRYVECFGCEILHKRQMWYVAEGVVHRLNSESRTPGTSTWYSGYLRTLVRYQCTNTYWSNVWKVLYLLFVHSYRCLNTNIESFKILISGTLSMMTMPGWWVTLLYSGYCGSTDGLRWMRHSVAHCWLYLSLLFDCTKLKTAVRLVALNSKRRNKEVRKCRCCCLRMHSCARHREKERER